MIDGSPESETINGTAGNDYINGSGGGDDIDGMQGYDIVDYAGNRAQFRTDLRPNEMIITKPGNAVDHLVSIEQINFDDGHLVFNFTSQNAPAAYRLYGGAFDRTPDEDGLRFWTNDWLDAGKTLHDAAAGFIASREFINLYGDELTNADFVERLYINVLGRDGEGAGIQYWNAFLNDGTGDRADVLVNFTQLPEYVNLSRADMENGFWVV